MIKSTFYQSFPPKRLIKKKRKFCLSSSCRLVQLLQRVEVKNTKIRNDFFIVRQILSNWNYKYSITAKIEEQPSQDEQMSYELSYVLNEINKLKILGNWVIELSLLKCGFIIIVNFIKFIVIVIINNLPSIYLIFSVCRFRGCNSLRPQILISPTCF